MPKKKASKAAIFKTGNAIVKSFEKYVDEKGFKSKYQTFSGGQVHTDAYVPISIVGYCRWTCTQPKTITRATVYDTFDRFPDAKMEIDAIIEEHITIGISIGDIQQSFGIFYLKNKCGYRDKVEQELTHKGTSLVIEDDITRANKK